MKINSEKYNIICLSNQLWDFPNWTNKRHVMSRLAKRDHNVLFVDPPLNLGRVFARQLIRGFWSLGRLFSQQKLDSSGARIYTPVNPLPFKKQMIKFHIWKIKRLAKKNFNKDRKTILWVYHVQLVHLKEYLDNLNYDKLVYDCVDNYEAFPATGSISATAIFGEDLVVQERELARKADITFATAPGLVAKLKKFSENVYFTPNVGDYERFKDVKSYKDQIPEDLKAIPRPRVGYIGALDDYKFDMELVKKCAKEYPSYSFVVIGPRALKDREASQAEISFEGLENVYLMGSRPYEQKHLYMAGFDVDIIPYVLNSYTVGGCFPVKFHDSLAAGLPVVVTDLPAYYPFADVCYLSKSEEEFCAHIKKALEEDSPAKIEARQKVAKENNWDGKVEKMLSLIAYNT